MDPFCLKVGAFDPLALQSRLGALGVGAEGLGTRYGSGGEGLSFYVTDPDGNHIELRG